MALENLVVLPLLVKGELVLEARAASAANADPQACDRDVGTLRVEVLACQAGVWERLHHELLGRLHRAGELDWSRTVADSSHIRALLGGSRRGHPRSIVAARAQSTTS